MYKNDMPTRTAWMISVLPAVWLLASSTAAQPTNDQAEPVRWAIARHGGSGGPSREAGRIEIESVEKSLRRALEAGKGILSKDGSALDAVQTVVVVLEDDPNFNAGRGAVFTRAGTHELDASIMDGATLRCGAVAGAKSQKNPIKAARLVMERTPHVLLAGEGADQFALENGCERVAQDYFYTPARFRELQKALAKLNLNPLPKPAYPLHFDDADATDDSRPNETRGTVGCVALDSRGNLAAATSTGGLTGKLPGRIGDSPIIGAGTYADNKTCAVSCTGIGEQFIRYSIAARVGWLMKDRGLTVDQAVRHCLEDILQPDDGGVIAINRRGHISTRASTGVMPRGMANSNGLFETALWTEPSTP